MVECQLPKLKVASSSLVARSKNQLLTLFAITVTGLASIFYASAQTPVPDAEMREIVRLVLEREIPHPGLAADGVVLLGANTKPGWIPQIDGLSIRKLRYDEEKLVAEYYDLSSTAKGNVIEIALLKGNYCRKVGRRFEFERKGTRDLKEVGYTETTTGGTSCDGCAVGSGAVYSVQNQFSVPGTASTPTEQGDEPLVLNGVVDSISCFKNDSNYIQCIAHLKLKFSNASVTPLIILEPTGGREFWHGGTRLALTEKESRSYASIYDVSTGQSISRDPGYRELADLLDQPAPPAKLTRILRPGESLSWDTSIGLRFLESNSCNQHVGVEIGWKEVKKLSSPLWLRVSYEMWPFNVENFRPYLGRDLKERWKPHGSLYVSDDSDEHSHARVTSAPIELHLNRVELTNPQQPKLSGP